MVKRVRGYGLQASEGVSPHGPFCWIGRVGRERARICVVDHADGIMKDDERGERASSHAEGSGAPEYRFERTGLESSRALAMACRWAAEAGLCRWWVSSATYAGGAERAARQDHPMMRAASGR